MISKARARRRIIASGWTTRDPQTWLKIYTAQSGLVEIWDHGRGRERYSVLTRYPGGEWLHSWAGSRFAEAVRAAMSDLGTVEPLS